MFKNLILCTLFITASIVISSPIIFAQEAEIAYEQEGVDDIIDEALDQVEQDIDPVESGSPDEIIEIPEITLEAAVPSEIGDLKEKIKDPELTPEVDAAIETEDLQEALENQGPEIKEALEAKIIPLLHAEASSLIEALNEMKSPDGEVAYNEDDRTLILMDNSESLEIMEAFVKEVDILLETETFHLKRVYAKDIIGKVEEALTKNIGQAHLDKKADSIVVTDTPAKIGKIRELMVVLDRIDREVLIKTKTLQIVLSDEHPSGVDWEAIVSDFQKRPLSDLDAGANDGHEGQISFGTISQEDFDILLEALDTVGVIRTVFEENIITENETEAVARILSSIPEGGQQGQDIQVHLVPSVTRDQAIEIVIRPEPVEWNSQESKAAPEDITVQVQDGATIVIGGLFEDTMVASTWKIPLLGDIPLLGFVFRNEGEEMRKAEIITFLTVKITEKKEHAEE